MAGENTLPVTEIPDHFQDVVCNITGVGAALADADDFCIFYAERDTVVDAVTFISSAADANDTFQLKLIASGGDPDTTLGLASGSITVTDISELTAGTKLTLVDATGTVHTLTEGSQDIAAKVYAAATGVNETADSLRAVIDNISEFTATRDGATVTITQVTPGTSGNTTISLDTDTQDGMTKVDFTGGLDKLITDAVICNAAYTPKIATVDTKANIIPAGSMIGLNTEINSAGVGNLTIQMRLRSRLS